MTEINDRNYYDLARKAAAAIGPNGFFSGSIECSHEGFESTLTATLLIHRQDEQFPEGVCSSVTNVVPVWWEFSVRNPGGDQTLSDFSFDEFREYLIDYFRTETL